jgi:ABC-2 type transport system ATP-binding protein
MLLHDGWFDVSVRRQGSVAIMRTDAVLDIRHFSKSYGEGRLAADDVSLTVMPGDIYGFIGHNGAGKSTTIRAVVGVLDFTDGQIYIDGHSVKDDPVACKRVSAYIPDNPDIYENLTGIQYLNFIADVFGLGGRERTEAISRYADLFEITDALGDLIGSYSHGMRQKVVVISALMHHPKLMVLDEPFVGLDPKATYTVKELMREMCREGGAVFFSTHVLDVAERLCNKIAIIRQGRIVAAGPIDELTGGRTLEETFLEALDA